MGAEQSQPEEKTGILQRFLPGRKQFEPLPIPKIIDLDFILNNPPVPLSGINMQITSNAHQIIVRKILDYNKTEWNFGNLTGEQPHKLMNETTYKLFLEFIKSKLNPSTTFTLSSRISVDNNNSFDKNTRIINEIHKIGIPEVNTFFSVKLTDLFPQINGLTDNDIINVTLLGLAAIIGAEHLVIYFLMCGANPGITYMTENEDTGTLMLLYQIALTKIQSSPKYFIILARMLYILFLLGSVESGIDLSKLFLSNFKILKRNQGLTQANENILQQLVKMPYIPIDFSNQNKSLNYITMKKGASIPLLFKVIEKNNIIEKRPKLWSNINTQDLPLGYTVLYSLLMNNTIDGKIKLSLVWYLIRAEADPLIIPNIRQNAKIPESLITKENQKNQTEIQLLFALLQESNIKILRDLLQILSINPKFKKIYDEFKITDPGINQDLRMTIEILKKNNERLRKILQEVEKQKFIQLNSAIKESALIGTISQNKAIHSALNTKQNLATSISRQTQQASQIRYPQNLATPISQASQIRYPQNLATPISRQNPYNSSGGKKKTMRTFYLLKHKKYYEYPFESERPITAAHNAYDFLKLNDKLGKKQIVLTIYDIANNKKYKYIAKTLKDGKNVLKSSK